MLAFVIRIPLFMEPGDKLPARTRQVSTMRRVLALVNSLVHAVVGGHPDE